MISCPLVHVYSPKFYFGVLLDKSAAHPLHISPGIPGTSSGIGMTRPFLPIKFIFVEFNSNPASEVLLLHMLGAILTYILLCGTAILISCFCMGLTDQSPRPSRSSSPRLFLKSVRPMRSPPRTALRLRKPARRFVLPHPTPSGNPPMPERYYLMMIPTFYMKTSPSGRCCHC